MRGKAQIGIPGEVGFQTGRNGGAELQRHLDIDPTLSVHTHESLVLLRSLVKNQGFCKHSSKAMVLS